MKYIKSLFITILIILSSYLLIQFITATWDLYNWYEVYIYFFVIFLPISLMLLWLSILLYRKEDGFLKLFSVIGIVIGVLDFVIPLLLLVRNLLAR